ncbi:MAG: cell division protein FtsH, partial [Gallionella sp.]|nr:cell division protein FtsH [Gallionella sp.]
MNNFKSIAIWLVVALVLMTVFNQLNSRQQQTAQAHLDYSQFLDEARNGHISKVVIEGRNLTGTSTDGKR